MGGSIIQNKYNGIYVIYAAMLMEVCVVLLQVSYPMFHKQGIRGQYSLLTLKSLSVERFELRFRINLEHQQSSSFYSYFTAATLMEACVVLLYHIE